MIDALLNRIGIGTKLMTLATLAVAAFSIPSYQIWQEKNESLAFTATEATAVIPFKQSMQLLKTLAQHKYESIVLSANPSNSSDNLNLSQQEWNATIKELEGQSLITGNQEIKDAVAQLKNNFNGLAQVSSAENEAAHKKINLELLALQSEIANVSGAALDPEAASYYLFDTAINKTPPLLNAISCMQHNGVVALLTKEAQPELVSEANTCAEDLANNTAVFEKAMSMAIQAQKDLNDPEMADKMANLKDGLTKALAATESLTADLKKLDESGEPAVTYPKQFEDTKQILLNSSLTLIDLFNGELEQRAQRKQHERNMLLGELAVILALMGLIVWFISRSIRGPLAEAAQSAKRIADGDFTEKGKRSTGTNEVSNLLQALDDMRLKLAENVVKLKTQLEENTRVMTALDYTSVSIMIADTDGKIIFTNRSVLSMLGEAEADLRKELPHFSVNKILGSNFDSFHKNPAHQRNLLGSLTKTYQAQIKVGVRTFRLTANPISNSEGQRIGTVVEWLDRTLEVAAEQEVADIVQGAANGDFSRRIETNGKQGFFLQVSNGLNQLLETSETGLNDVVNMLNALSKGDLTPRITADYQGTFGQLKNDSNKTAEQLKEIVERIQESTDAINTAAKEIASGNTNLSSRTEQQASSLEETASSMEELTSTVKQNAENSRNASQLAIGASTIAMKGGNVVAEVVTTMDDINSSSKKIVDIISVIDGIAFQTNILALNAAVEAARAGEQGRGFAVVASEVRSLAQRSAAAAKEIKSLISDSVSKVENGSRLVEQAGATMTEIVDAVKKVTEIMTEITTASLEQSSGIEQVNIAITQMDEATQQNAALVEEAAAAAESLEEQAQNLSQLVSVFRLSESGGTRTLQLQAPSRSSKALSKPVPPSNSKNRPTIALPRRSGDDNSDEWEEF